MERHRGRPTHRRSIRTTATGFLIGLTVLGLASCTPPPVPVPNSIIVSTPQATVNIPGSYTFTTHTDLGNPAGTIILCSSVRTTVLVKADSGFEAYVSSWNGAAVQHYPPFAGYKTALAFGPVDPGCGQFSGFLFVDIPPPGGYNGPTSITFTFTSCDPNGTLQDCQATA